MKKTQQLTLIKGTFSPKEAQEILLNLFTSKIQFHEIRNFSSMERFGKKDKVSSKRIPALKKNIEKLNKILKAAEKNDNRLLIDSHLKIELVQGKSI